MKLQAGVPEAIKYQAVARDNNGNVIANRNIGIRLSILKSTLSGTVVYSERHAAITSSLGLINLEIGKGTVLSGSISNINWGDDNYFIKIEMDDNGRSNYTLVGTSQLVSVPYALYAKEAANGTQWSDTTNNIYFNTGKVGVGTNNPKTSLEIYNNQRRGSRVQITGETPSLRMTDTAYTGNGVIIGVAADSNDLIPRAGKGDVVFTNEAYGTGGGYIFGTGVPSQTCVKITDDCKVGIGTDAPVSKLDVKGGDVNIEDIGSGVIMKSPDGNCWRMTVSNTGQPVFTSIQCLNNTGNISGISHTNWVYRYTPDERFFPNYNYQDSSGSFIKNGEAKYTNTSIQIANTYYRTSFSILVPAEINLYASDTLRLLARIKNDVGDVNGTGGYDVACGLLFNSASASANWIPGTDSHFAVLQAGNVSQYDNPELLTDTRVYNEYEIALSSNQITAKVNNLNQKSLNYSSVISQRLSQLYLTFRGNATVDWVKLYKGNKLIMIENFNVDGTTSAVWTMP